MRESIVYFFKDEIILDILLKCEVKNCKSTLMNAIALPTQEEQEVTVKLMSYIA